MKECGWIDFLFNINNISLPIVIENDCCFKTELHNTFSTIKNGLTSYNAPKNILKIYYKYSNKIIDSVNEYYKGNIVKANIMVKSLLDDCCLDNKLAITKIKDSIAFKVVINRKRKNNKEIQFFKARLSDEITTFKSNDMYHIPINKRSITNSCRFSIPGLPCMYIGNTSYVCWLEMGCPQDRSFNVSPIVVNNKLKVLNLAFDKNYFYYIFDSNNKNKKTKLENLFKLYLINIATSFVVREKNRKFKSEYIFPQMLMLACKEKKVDGIIYYSKRVENEVFAQSTCINIALIIDDEFNELGISNKIYKNVIVGDSYNYSKFEQLLDIKSFSYENLWIDNVYNMYKTIGTFKNNFTYNETKFYKFDHFLFSRWSKEEKSFKYRPEVKT